MEISFTRQQYRDLLIMIYLGEWMINANKIDDREQAFEELASYVYSFAEAAGFGGLVDGSSGNGRHYASSDLEDLCESYIGEYDNHTFWDELAERLAERDFVARYGRREIAKMTPEERFERRSELAERYGEEFEKHGLKRLVIGMTGG